MLSKTNYLRSFIKPHSLLYNASFNSSTTSKEKKWIQVVENESKKTACVTMQRLPANSLNLEFLNELTSVIKELEGKKFRGMILSSSSPTIFSAGLDINEMYKPEKERLKQFWTALQNMWKTLYVTPLITVAAVNGHAIAGGCILTLSCDHSIMVKPRTTIGLNETRLGIFAPKWFESVFVNTIGFRNAENALKWGTLFTAEEALKLNMIHEVVDSPAQLQEKAEEQMEQFLKIPEIAFKMTKNSLRKPFVDELISYEKEEQESIVKFISQDSIQAVLEKYIENLKGKKK
ncbi:enoyl-CoA delta isomerase 1, mitochondrial [Parasteatoda tepidariorum]|nr:enoyl-CoA delta isomerase 1, mitochondrial [Parasteatoda tepidariorum]